MNGSILTKAGAAIDDVAASIAKSNWYKSVVPTNMNSELASYVAGSSKHNVEFARNAIRDTLSSGMEITDDVEAAIQKISTHNLNASIDKNLKDIAPEAVLNIAKKRANESITGIDGQKVIKQMTQTERLMATPGAYFSNPNKKVRNTRIATAAAAYAGVAVGGRYLSGGTLTSDKYGQKDIAGIPFV